MARWLRLSLCLTAALMLAWTGTVVAQPGKTPVQPRKIPDVVWQKVRTAGVVGVIVELNTDVATTPKGALRQSVQRQAIAAAQDRLPASLARTKYRIIHRLRLSPIVGLVVGADALAVLERSPLVKRVQWDGPPSRLALPQSVPLVEADQAWGTGFDGTGWTIAILDTGVDNTHPFLTGKVVSEACFSRNSNCPNGQPQMIGPGAGVPCTFAADDCKHGTHVAGIAAGLGSGTTTFSGVARGANLIAVEIFSQGTTPDDCGGSPPPCTVAFPMDQIAALDYVYSVQVTFQIASVNMSLGGGGFPDQASCDMVNPTMEKDKIDQLSAAGIATVIAAGNDRYIDFVSWPGCISTAIGVGSTTKDPMGVISSFSNLASFLSLVAPGGTNTGGANDIYSAVPGGGFDYFAGTSQAAPHVAGAWAILKQKKPAASVLSVLAALQTTSLPIQDIRSQNTDFRKQTIQCRIRILKALNYLTTTFTMFDAPAAAAHSEAYGINHCGQIVGFFVDASGREHGFQRNPDGTFTTIDHPTALFGTEVYGINNAGQIIGNYGDGTGAYGFRLDTGTCGGGPTCFNRIAYPGANGTYARGITNPVNRVPVYDTGKIVGYFNVGPAGHGFLLDSAGTPTQIDFPGATETTAFGINNTGQIVGSYFDGIGHHGFLRNSDGTFAPPINVPGATLTKATGINDGRRDPTTGQIVGYSIVGYFRDSTGTTHGFLRNPDGTFNTIDVPGGTNTVPFGINNAAQIVGTSNDVSGTHAFLFNSVSVP